MPPSKSALRKEIRHQLLRRVAFSITWESWNVSWIAAVALWLPYGARVETYTFEPYAGLATRVDQWAADIAALLPTLDAGKRFDLMKAWRRYANGVIENGEAAYANSQPLHADLQPLDLCMDDASREELVAIREILAAAAAMDRFRLTVVGEVIAEPGAGAAQTSAAMYAAAAKALRAIDDAT